MNYPYLEKTHMRRQDRSNPIVTILTVPKALRSSGHGKLTEDQSTRWKPASPKTYLELAMNGSLSVEQMRDAFERGSLTGRQFKRAFWKWFDPEGSITVKTIKIIRDFSPVLI